MILEEAEKKIESQKILISKLKQAMRNLKGQIYNYDYENQGLLARVAELQEELRKYKEGQAAGKEGISPLIHTGSNVKHKG